jgi:hypothetical protein
MDKLWMFHIFFGLKNMISTHTKDFFVKTRAFDCHILDLVFKKKITKFLYQVLGNSQNTILNDQIWLNVLVDDS